jgi:hypothetical protein
MKEEQRICARFVTLNQTRSTFYMVRATSSTFGVHAGNKNLNAQNKYT